MIKIILSLIISLHGLIHLLGFVKEWRLADVSQLTGKTLFQISGGMSKFIGLLWLIVCILFIVSAVLYFLDKNWWWMIAGVSIVMSQVLIVIYWQDAKFGTIANIIILIACILSYGTWSFNRMVSGELQSFLSTTIEKKVVTREMVAHLPVSVQKWLERSNVFGKDLIQTVRLKQTGEMRTEPEGNWMPVEAEQYFTIENPGFIWKADVKAAPFINISGRDKYENGKGYMLIKLLSLFSVVDSKGNEIDQGALLRFLAEIMWFPSAALSDYITWEEIDTTSARATMSYGNITASGVFGFNEYGDVISFEAKRYYERKGESTLETWLISIDGESHKEFEGIRIPARSTATWKFKTGDFTWFRVEIKEIIYNELHGKE